LSFLKKEILRRLTPQPIKLRADFELTCYSLRGIEDIKESLLAGKKAAESKEVKVSII